MILILARHTEPEGGRVWRILGHKDIPLSEDGKRHWRKVARQLERLPIEAVYSSDLSRASWCGTLIASKRGLPAQRLKELREMDCGALDGMTREEAKAQYPEAFEGLRSDPVNYRIPEGETLQEVHDRVVPVVEGIRMGSHRCVLMVAHAVVNRSIICAALQLPLPYAYRIDQSYGGLSVIEYGGSYPLLHTVNAPCVPESLPARLAGDEG